MFDLEKSKIVSELNGGKMHLVIPISNDELLDIPPYAYSEQDKIDYRQAQNFKHLKSLKQELERVKL